MKRPVFAIRPEMKVGAALDLAAEHGVHHLPVLVSDALMGMVCTCDLVDHPLESSVTRAIRTPLVSVPVNASAGDALALMIQTGVGSLIVLDDGQPFGIVTRGDLLASGADPRLCCRYCGSKEHLRVDGTDAMACVDCADRSRPPLAEDELGGSG